jgi:hypothetical protein
LASFIFAPGAPAQRQIRARVGGRSALRSRFVRRQRLRRKTNFAFRFNPMSLVQPLRPNIYLSFFQKL